MKPQVAFVLGVLSAGLVSAVPSEVNDVRLEGFNDDINKTINSIVANLPDPIEINDLPLNFNATFLNGYANITEFRLEGLKSIVASIINIDIWSLSLNSTVDVPSIKLRTNYDTDVLFAKLFPFYGKGSASVAINNFEISVGGRVNLTTPLHLSNVTALCSLESITFDLHGILNNEELSLLIADVLNDVVASFINDHKQAISNIISSIVEQLIDSIFGGGGESTQMAQLRQAIEEIHLKS